MNIKKIKPLFTAVVVTSNIYPCDYKEHNIIAPKANKLKEAILDFIDAILIHIEKLKKGI